MNTRASELRKFPQFRDGFGVTIQSRLLYHSSSLKSLSYLTFTELNFSLLFTRNEKAFITPQTVTRGNVGQQLTIPDNLINLVRALLLFYERRSNETS